MFSGSSSHSYTRTNWYPPAAKSYLRNRATDRTNVMAETKMAKYQASLGRFRGRNMDNTAPANGTRIVSSKAAWSKLLISTIKPGYLDISHQKMANPIKPSAMARA